MRNAKHPAKILTLFYLNTSLALMILLTASGWAREKILWDFISNRKGAHSLSALVSDSQGNLYGTTSQGGHYGHGSVFELAPLSGGGWSETVLYSFTGGTDGNSPDAAVVIDSTGSLYGTTAYGGSSGCGNDTCGTVFQLRQVDGKWKFKVIHAFQESDGANPFTPLILDSKGNLFGTTLGVESGGCCGNVFKLSPDAHGEWHETVLYNFPCISGCQQGGLPSSGVVFDAEGNLYGTTYGGTTGQGTVYELSPNSGGKWTEKTLYTFCTHSPCVDGATPSGELVFDQAGTLYGTTRSGGSKRSNGVVFTLKHVSKETWNQSVLYRFHGGKDGRWPFAGLAFGPDGNLYGTTVAGGSRRACQGNGCGTVFTLARTSKDTWAESVVHSFLGGHGGIAPQANLIIDSSGNLYGTTFATGIPPDFYGGGTVFKLAPSSGGWVESFYKFPETDGAHPSNTLVADAQGNLYGATGGGGLGYGTVFELSPQARGRWRKTILYEFKGGADGKDPSGGLVSDNAGNLYGVTFNGGAPPPNDYGVVYQLSPGPKGKWKEKVIHVFESNSGDGVYPTSWLVFDPAGNLYGTTYEGGTMGGGTIYMLSPSKGGTWTETIVHNFAGGSDGCNPLSGVTLDKAGNVYGTTYGCGMQGGITYGIAFELSPSSGIWNETVLHTFTGGSDGGWPFGGVILDSSGNLYGPAYTGGNGVCAYNYGCGVIFQLSSRGKNWHESVIYNFSSLGNANPYGPLIFDSAGNLYGTASDGAPGNYCCGTVFKLSPGQKGKWKETTLHSFQRALDGAYPDSGLLLDATGDLYGTTSFGGPANEGVVFEIIP